MLSLSITRHPANPSCGWFDPRSKFWRAFARVQRQLGSRPRARGPVRRDARRSDHVTLMRGAAALAMATNMRAVHFRHEASS
jgi:hypothetical protein